MRKTAFITGASTGTGLEIARLFTENGYATVLVARNVNRLKEIKNEIQKSFSTPSRYHY